MLSEKDGFLNIPKDFYIVGNFLVKEIFFSKDKQTIIRAFISSSKQNQTTAHCLLFKRHIPPSSRMRKLAWERAGLRVRWQGVWGKNSSAISCQLYWAVTRSWRNAQPYKKHSVIGVLGYGQVTTSCVIMNTQWLRDQVDTQWMEILSTPNAADGDLDHNAQ